MGQQTIRYRILANGRVEEEVIGVQGASCHALTSTIEASLGSVLASRPTAEAFDQVTAGAGTSNLQQAAPLQQCSS
ncbi:MAG: DUF2997 domain-containing protein [Cyanobacteria bacterium]|nr:DUF2997 domain-containing protein [Cyanobacteriota bacterium]